MEPSWPPGIKWIEASGADIAEEEAEGMAGNSVEKAKLTSGEKGSASSSGEVHATLIIKIAHKIDPNQNKLVEKTRGNKPTSIRKTCPGFGSKVRYCSPRE